MINLFLKKMKIHHFDNNVISFIIYHKLTQCYSKTDLCFHVYEQVVALMKTIIPMNREI